tara:strand:- start:695 stop:886 length:192 start_codon:yes stop_codon:yes gene_type:complete
MANLPTTRERMMTIMTICDVSLNGDYESQPQLVGVDIDAMLDAIAEVATFGRPIKGKIIRGDV